MFATVESSTVAICANASFESRKFGPRGMQIKRHKKAAGFYETLRLVVNLRLWSIHNDHVIDHA